MWGSAAKQVRLRKERHPEKFCPDARCLWTLKSGPCPKHGRNVPVTWMTVEEIKAKWPPKCDDPGAHRPGCQCDGGEPLL